VVQCIFMRTPPSTMVVMLRCAYRSLIVKHRRPGTPAKSQLLPHTHTGHAPLVSPLHRVWGRPACHPARPIRCGFLFQFCATQILSSLLYTRNWIQTGWRITWLSLNSVKTIGLILNIK
jgi:hypothetical protein